MSIALMTSAWKSSFHSGKKMVLLALCDNANDQGECFPSVSMLAEKCSMSERSVFNHISDLEKDGAISRQNRSGRSTVYQLNPCKFCTPTPATVAEVQPLTPATVAPPPLQPLHPPLQILHPTPATVAPITIIEPSPNHQLNQYKHKANAFSLPDWIPGETWEALMETRKAKKAKNTDYALKLLVKTIERIKSDGFDPVEAMNNSIKCGWSDVYAPKNKVQQQKQSAGKHFGFGQMNYKEGINEDGTFA